MQIERVTERFGEADSEVVAVRDVSFEVAAGEVLLIMGPSGLGKSTLLLMLGALLKPSAGTLSQPKFRQQSTAGAKSSGDDHTAMALLERRYAAGEISREEFEERRQTLLETRRR